MRLRNIPRADRVIKEHKAVIKRPEDQRGCWRQVFGNEFPIHMEIGMGKGKFLLQMAAEHPQINYIGVERYSSVLLRALERYDAEEEVRKEKAVKAAGYGGIAQESEKDGSSRRRQELRNIRFLCMDAGEVESIFRPGEVERIYLNFSDPWPKARHARRRLTSGEFLEKYAHVLPTGGRIEFKTDNTELFRFSLEQIREAAGWILEEYTYDLHHQEEMSRGNVMTEYEEKFSAKGNPIHKMVAVRK